MNNNSNSNSNNNSNNNSKKNSDNFKKNKPSDNQEIMKVHIDNLHAPKKQKSNTSSFFYKMINLPLLAIKAIISLCSKLVNLIAVMITSTLRILTSAIQSIISVVVTIIQSIISSIISFVFKVTGSVVGSILSLASFPMLIWVAEIFLTT